MKKHLISSLLLSLFMLVAMSEDIFCQNLSQPSVGSGGGAPAYNPAPQNQQPLQFQEEYKVAKGMSGASVILSTGELWLVSMTGNPNNSFATAGVYSSPQQIAGGSRPTPPRVTVTATFQVVEVQNAVALVVEPKNEIDGAYSTTTENNTPAISRKVVSKPGTYEVTSLPFTMKPSTNYKGLAYASSVNTTIPKNQAMSAYVKIISLKFNLP